MKAIDTHCSKGKYQYIFNLPFHYGYGAMILMAQFVIDSFFNGEVKSFRGSLIAGSPQKEYRLYLRLHGNALSRCMLLQKEQGVLFLRGYSSQLDDEIEFVWYNQTSILCILSNYGNEVFESGIESMVDELTKSCFPNYPN